MALLRGCQIKLLRSGDPPWESGALDRPASQGSGYDAVLPNLIEPFPKRELRLVRADLDEVRMEKDFPLLQLRTIPVYHVLQRLV